MMSCTKVSPTGEPARPMASYATIPDWCALSGLSRSATYNHLGLGNLRAVKLGKRVLIDVPHGLTWLASLPAPQIRAPQAAATFRSAA